MKKLFLLLTALILLSSCAKQDPCAKEGSALYKKYTKLLDNPELTEQQRDALTDEWMRLHEEACGSSGVGR